MLVTRYESKFWLSCLFLSLASGWISYQYIGQVYSLFNVSISVDREMVLVQAQNLAQELGWDLEGYRHVISFESQDDLQCFIELEAGGKEAFVDMFQSHRYYPYQWHVRFFKEKTIVEMHVYYSPQGNKVGFYKKMAEETPGQALSKESAQAKVEEALPHWCLDFKHYKLIEYKSETLPNGRVDHVFTYERADISLGQGMYRFQAVVSGDEITQLQPTIKIPDNFMRRYKDMRSANNLLAAVGEFFFKGLYFFVFGLLGLVVWYRRNYLLSIPAAYGAGIVAGGMFLRGLNEASLWWLSYNTVQSTFAFIAMNILQQFLGFISLFFMIFLVLVVAEAAGRFVYKEHIQFFKIFDLKALGSYEVAQQVAIGYLLVPCMFLFVTLFGYVTKNYYGWWSPAGSVTDPNIVASWYPWLSAISIALFAGFFEELICRALPFAMGKFLTRHSKYQHIWFWVIFILQSLIFGACHANYPNQPFYARLIELIPVSFVFGWLYVTFGLLPGIITHFVYDAVWFALPIFASSLWWSKCMVIILIALPALAVLSVYIYYQKFHVLSDDYCNKAFVDPEYLAFPTRQRVIGESIPNRRIHIITSIATLAVFIALYFVRFSSDVQPMCFSKEQALQIAYNTVRDTFGMQLDANWKSFATAYAPVDTIPHRFIWQVYGKQAYAQLQGSYLEGLVWKVRFVKLFDTVEARGQEYSVMIASGDKTFAIVPTDAASLQKYVTQVEHVVPEHIAGADITQEQAVSLAYDFIQRQYGITQQDLKLMSIDSSKFEHRRDWVFYFKDLSIFDFDKDGYACIIIKLAGDQIKAFNRTIYVPESWQRMEQERLVFMGMIKSLLCILLFILCAFGSIFAIFRVVGSRLGTMLLKKKIIFMSSVMLLYIINSMIVLMANFTTAEPFYDQLIKLILALSANMIWQVLVVAVFLTTAAVSFRKSRELSWARAWCLASCVAVILFTAYAILRYYQPSLAPLVADYTPMSHYNSTLAMILQYIQLYYRFFVSMIIMFVVLKTIKGYFSHSTLLQYAVVLFFSVALQALQNGSTPLWIFFEGVIRGTLLWSLYLILFQYDMTLLPLSFGVLTGLHALEHLIYPLYVGAQFDSMCAIIVVIFTSWIFYRWSHQE